MERRDTSYKTVKKLTIMGNDDDTTSIGTEIRFQPQQRIKIQVVGRLIEQQNVRLLEQQFRERNAHLPATAKGFCRLLKLRFLKAKAGDHFRNFGISAKSAQFFETMLEKRTIPKVLRVLKDRGLKIPRRDHYGDIQWREPTTTQIAHILHNPAYAGAFVCAKAPSAN